MKGFYYIKNSVDEYHSEPSVYTETLEEAKEAIKYCEDWYRPRGTGKIFFQPTDFEMETEPDKYKRISQKRAEFICRGDGLDENGNVIFSDKEW